MSKTKFPYADAIRVANELVAILLPVCERIEIAGSLRRCKPEVGDVEILYVGRRGQVPDGLFTREDDVAELKIADMLHAEVLAMRPNVKGFFAWGGKNKLGVHGASGIPVDLFATTEANWFTSLVIRTGGKETNLKLTTSAQRRGRSLMAYGCGVRMPDNSVERAESEEHLFELCGVPYLEPRERP